MLFLALQHVRYCISRSFAGFTQQTCHCINFICHGGLPCTEGANLSYLESLANSVEVSCSFCDLRCALKVRKTLIRTILWFPFNPSETQKLLLGKLHVKYRTSSKHMNERETHSKTLCYTANLQLQIAQKQSNLQSRAQKSNSVNSTTQQPDKPGLRCCRLGIAADLTDGAA